MPTSALPRARFELRPSAPYSLELTLRRFSRFPERVDIVRHGTYRRLIRQQGQPLLIAVRQIAPPSRPRLAVELVGPGARRRAARACAEGFIERALGTRHELKAFYRTLADDPLIGESIRTERGLSVSGHGDLFEAIVTAILSQQVNLSLAYSIRYEIADRFGRRARIDGQTWFSFPEARRLARTPPETLRGMRLSNAKSEAIVRAARAFDSGALDEPELRSLDDEAVIERLTALKGIGRWTAETALIRGMARRDAFPAGDLGVVKYLARGLLGKAEPASEGEMRSFAERWRPYRTYALVYAYAELARRRA